MKNKTGIVVGFVIGVAGFLLFISFFLGKVVEELDAPGAVLIASVISGLVFAFVGYLIQNHSGKKIKIKGL
jgi:divalent metal cation (Fe/Co/Zn/Cd) transporter